ncbi:hypothetical protein GCM10022237_22740 [Nocardioides ginsengisoli]|uniref:Type VII secretion protein EccB n=1 Tax=Nocardioides ginsengisoli TaxID=363868 RepID=A0ABW3VZV5_9ACTN
MATKKDLVEAYSFSRRRLVTAFVSGAPGGREVEPARPGRMVVGGVALAILLVAAAAIAGTLAKRAEVEWDKPGLVTDDRGALYIILDESSIPGQPRLRPVINVTSAQLILGADVKTRKVPEQELADRRKGPPIGILDAPATVPRPDQLIESGWTSCTGTGLGLKTAVQADALVTRMPTRAVLVQGATSKARYLIAEADVAGHPRRAYRYPMPDDDALAFSLHVAPSSTVTVPDAWLELFPTGGPLSKDGIGLTGLGGPAGQEEFPGGRVGDWFHDDAGQEFALTQRGVVELTPVAAAVLKRIALPGGGAPKELTYTSGMSFHAVPAPYAAAMWPRALPTGTVEAQDQVCAELVTGKGDTPAALLATAPQGAASAEGVAADERDIDVESGRGALVRSADWITATGGSPHLVDDRGYSYPVAGDVEIGNLGYADVPALVVPDVWNKLFEPGPELSLDDALCPPSRTQKCG